MDIVENIVNFFKSPPEETKGKAPKGMCPVCWGYQEYDGKIREMYKDKQIDVNNHEAIYMWIEEFVKEHLDGMELKKGLVHAKGHKAHEAHEDYDTK